MARLLLILISAFLALSACTPVAPTIGPDGKPLPRVYRISNSDTAKIQFRVLDSVNALRVAAGKNPLELDSKLTAAAATHARDMSVQNRPWHFGSDGSSPLDRVARAGYDGQMIGENISESYENESETVAAWMETPSTREVIMSSRANKMGFSWYQEPNGKIWWTMVTGS
ncbi:divisome-associated lipoprotein DalA [Litoreibacter arenae]|uniref:Transmembrane protein n=1 Tax=Litoreibacter arenae DSM 19593 TaxID=1123360 RepID=S9RHY0_9RHOB|nr:CAP domain-containing protein [Litoreibacter arenae]EPX77700.1 Putative transmembrane protein [Litoreibacter arenae DSM 19593]